MDSKAAAKRIADEAIVLLKNESRLLPLAKGQRAAFFGRTQLDTIYSGNGSGAAHKAGCKNILEECERREIHAEPGLKAYYMKRVSEEEPAEKDAFDWADIGKVITSGVMYEIFGKYHAPAEEYEISEQQLQAAGAYTDTAILVLGRNSGGEECDRHLDGDYYLTDSEKKLAEQVCTTFRNVVLILNINGLIDLSWTEEYQSIKSILFAGILGEEGASALADILVGNVNPSGRLAFTIAKRYEDYPATGYFTWDKEDEDKLLTYESYGLNAAENGSVGYAKSPVTVYGEDIYAGYRYFDTFAKEPLYAFGHGLSYTEFVTECSGAEKKREGIEVNVCVRNTGGRAGKEVVQLYLAACGGTVERAARELKGFEKTDLLQPGEEAQICLMIPWRELGYYDEARAAYVISQGEYRILAGTSSRNTKEAALVRAEQDLLLEQCENRLGIRECNRGKIAFLGRLKNASCRKQPDLCSKEAGVERITNATRPEGMFSPPKILINAKDVLFERGNVDGKVCADGSGADRSPGKGGDMRDSAVKQLSTEQLAALCVGYGPGTPFAAFGDGSDPETICGSDGKPLTTNSHPAGCSGYVSPAIEEAGIYSVSYKDGPAGIGETAWPSEMLAACAFNRRIWYEFGNAVGAECEMQQVDVWLAPAVNLHRHPLGGRNFEYFSEDPYLTGICACEVTKGVQENHPVRVCPKHFAANEQETFRRGSGSRHYDAADSILSERAARELYLKPFEMLVKEADVVCLMTSFNKINGVFSAGNADLCTHILRGEWGYRGVVVTDWGDMDVVADGADAVAAGNDIVMPGGPPVIAQLLQGYREGRVSRENMEDAVRHLLYMTQKTEGGRHGK